MKAAARTSNIVVLCLILGCAAEPPVTVTASGARSGQLQFLGQPSAGDLARLQADGVDIVINARPDSEMDWDEAAAATGLGLEYHAIPISRSGPGFDRESIERITAIVDANPDRDIVLHCSSGNRVSAWYAIYLVQREGLTREEALQRARAVGLTRAALEQRIGVYLDGP